MNGREFIRRIKKLARRTGAPVRVVDDGGKGSHKALWYGARRTTVKHGEISPGLLHDMLKQLGLRKEDL
jgi:hypothetical protein